MKEEDNISLLSSGVARICCEEEQRCKLRLRDPAVDSEQFRRDLKTYLFAGHSSRGDSALEVLRNRAL